MYNDQQWLGGGVADRRSAARLPSFDLDAFRDKSYLTHGLHPYPAKFVPQIPQLILAELTRIDSVVLDPFCGSGTTLVEGMLAGANVVGLDSNALAVKIARAKTTALTDDLAKETFIWCDKLACLESEFLTADTSVSFQPVVPEFKNRSHWFTDEACVELGLIRALIDAEAAEETKNLIEVVFSSIIVKCSRQESDTRWCAVDKGYRVGDALALMQSRLKAAIARAAELSARLTSATTPSIFCEDARHMTSVRSQSVDAIITSPPYLNSFDYYLYHKLRMFWLGIDHYKIQDAEIGSRNKHCDNKQGVETFIAAMQGCVNEFDRVLKPNGLAVIVIGDSIFKDELLSMDVIYNKLMNTKSFKLLDQFSFNQRKYTRAFTPNVKTREKKSHIMLFGR